MLSRAVAVGRERHPCALNMCLGEPQGFHFEMELEEISKLIPTTFYFIDEEAEARDLKLSPQSHTAREWQDPD